MIGTIPTPAPKPLVAPEPTAVLDCSVPSSPLTLSSTWVDVNVHHGTE